MNTANLYTVMPGDRYDGPDPEGVMTRDAFVALLEDFARRRALPVETGTCGHRTAAGRGRRVRRGDVARPAAGAGGGDRERQPQSSEAPGIGGGAAGRASPDRRLGLSQRRRPCPAGPCWWSAAPSPAGRSPRISPRPGAGCFLATGRVGRLPRRYRGGDMSIWLGRERAVRHAAEGRDGRRPTLGALHTISLQSLSAQGVVLLGRFAGVEGGRLRFADDLEENIRSADEASAAVRRDIDAYIARRRHRCPGGGARSGRDRRRARAGSADPRRSIRGQRHRRR